MVTQNPVCMVNENMLFLFLNFKEKHYLRILKLYPDDRDSKSYLLHMIKFELQDNAAFVCICHILQKRKSQNIIYIVISKKIYPFEDSLQTLFPLSPRRLFPVFTFAARARLSIVRGIVESKVLALLRLLCFTPLLTLLSKLGAVLLHKEPPVLVAPPLPLIVHAPPLLLLV